MIDLTATHTEGTYQPSPRYIEELNESLSFKGDSAFNIRLASICREISEYGHQRAFIGARGTRMAECVQERFPGLSLYYRDDNMKEVL